MYFVKAEEFILLDKKKFHPKQSQAFPKQNNHRSFSTCSDNNLWNV